MKGKSLLRPITKSKNQNPAEIQNTEGHWEQNTGKQQQTLTVDKEKKRLYIQRLDDRTQVGNEAQLNRINTDKNNQGSCRQELKLKQGPENKARRETEYKKES